MFREGTLQSQARTRSTLHKVLRMFNTSHRLPKWLFVSALRTMEIVSNEVNLPKRTPVIFAASLIPKYQNHLKLLAPSTATQAAKGKK